MTKTLNEHLNVNFSYGTEVAKQKEDIIQAMRAVGENILLLMTKLFALPPTSVENE